MLLFYVVHMDIIVCECKYINMCVYLCVRVRMCYGHGTLELHFPCLSLLMSHDILAKPV